MLVNGAVAEKSARLVAPGDAVVVNGDPPRYVGRGGLKLEHALDEFEIDPTGRDVLDVGASTGGFTDCLLQRGAARVVALDVGHGQLHQRLREDPRVTVIERRNIRDVAEGELPFRPDLVVVDVSFISITKIVGAIVRVAAPAATVVVLVKPQFEAGRVDVARGRGVITDPALHDAAIDAATASLRDVGATVRGVVRSPITGADGNVEFLLAAELDRHAVSEVASSRGAA